MAKNIDKTSSDSENSLCSSSSSPPMSNKYRYMFNRLFRFANSWKKSNSPRGRRIFHRDVEKEEFQYASSHCLSSYYSVFVVRLAIMVMLAILIGLLTILTWHFTKIYTKKSLSSLAYGLRYELLQRPILRMWNILNSTSEITTAQVKLSQYVIRRYSNPASQAEQVELYEAMRAVTWSLFASRKALNSITINYKNGFVQAFHRDLKDNNTFYIYSDLSNYSMVATTSNMLKSISTHQAWDDKTLHGNFSAIWYREPLDPVTGEKIGKAMKIAPEDLINIAGLSQVPDGVATWHVAVSKFTDSPLLSAALPVWDSSNKSIMAVVGVTTAFYSVGQLMRELVEMHSGHMYLTSQQGYLLATSTSAPLLTNSTKPPPKLKMAVDCEDEIIRLGAEWLQRTYGNHFPNSTHEVHVENAKLGNQQYYIDSFYLNLKRLPLVGVIIIPRKYIMGQVDERSFKTLVILISASLCIFVIGCVCILILTNGVSKEMNLRAELISQLEARRKAEASSNYKSQFLANMSHELRTPMAAVIGLLDILISDDCLTNEQYSTVTQIRKCSTALLRLLNNILDLSKVESGKLVLEDAEFDLGRELEGLVDMFSVQCINHNVETVLDLSDDMPKLVRGDSGRVVQVFANLINNSIKFTTSGHVILRGWCEYPNSCNDSPNFYLDQKKSRNLHKSKEKPNASHAKRISMRDNKVILWFEVEDTGCGIDPSKWDSVFESFEQADPSTTRLHGGTGLGLCIVRNLVNKMGGFLPTKKETLLFPFFLSFHSLHPHHKNQNPPFTPFFLIHSPSMAEQDEHEEMRKLFSSYIGLSFSVFLALLPTNLREHSQRTIRAEEELRQLKSRRQEDYKANARVAEIFASHRNSWRDEEKRLLRRIDAASEEIVRLRAVVEDSKARVEDLEREVVERDEMIGFISRRFQEEEGLGGCGSREDMVGNTAEEVDVIYQQQQQQQQHNQHLPNGFDSEFSGGSKFWAEKASLWQDVQYESLESMYNTKQFVARRESPWKVDGDSAGVSSKLKLLEQELLNLDKIGKDVPSKVSSSIKKQAKRYQSLSEKIDELCRRIASDPCEPSLSSEFRTQTQTEFLLEAFRLQQDASETAQKLMALHTEVGKSHYKDELRGEITLTTRRSMDSIRNNFRELQRNLEIWLARIIGDLEGILARDGASRVREYYISRYPFVQ